MMSQNWLSCRSLAVIVCASLIGLTTHAYTSLATPTSQQSKNNINSARATNSFGIHEGMKYKKARNILIQKGWIPNLQGEPPNLRDSTVKELFELGYEEVKDCAVTGLGQCRFEFTNAAGKLLVVSTISAGNPNSERVIWRYFIEEGEQVTDNNQSYSTSNKPKKLPFIGTRYFNFEGGSGTGRTITIQSDGTTIVKIHGTVSSGIEYSGKFSNPIIFAEGDGLLLRGDKIYRLSTNGQIAKGCKGEESLCESDLYQP